MSILYCGIDEAGYGPMLGPLTMAAAVFRVHGVAPTDPTPDLWDVLKQGVAPRLTGARDRVVIADSKRLKLTNAGKRHPLTHLERGVLAMLGTRDAADGPIPETDSALHDLLRAPSGRPAWYRGEPVTLPMAHQHEAILLTANGLRGHMVRHRVELVAIVAASVDEPAFNEMLSRTRSKGAIVAHVTARLMARALEHRRPDDELRFALDRQSGRTKCAGILGEALTGVDAVEESPRRSMYTCAEGRVLFMPEAEEHHLPVALASMTAKYLRELSMFRFNRYWGERIPELKPTAGYVQDARRWLRDAADHLTPDDREAMIRKA